MKALGALFLIAAAPLAGAGQSTAAAEGAAAQRLTCMLGEEPDQIAKGRGAGQSSDAAEACIAALVRTAQDGRLPDLYRTLLAQLGGDLNLTEKLPVAIGEATLKGDGKLAIGGGKTIDVPPSLAFDAGFTAAYLKDDDRGGDLVGPQLRRVANLCLAVKKDAGTCFSAGYVYGQQAVRSHRAASR